MPEARSSLRFPESPEHVPVDYTEHFEDAPLYTLGMLILRQFLGYPLFLLGMRTDNRKVDSFICHFLRTYYVVIFEPSSTLVDPLHSSFVYFQKSLQWCDNLGYRTARHGMSSVPSLANLWLVGCVKVLVSPITDSLRTFS